MNLFSSFWERWFGDASREKRKAAPRRARRRQNHLGYEWLEDRRLLTTINEVQALSSSQFQGNVSSFALTVPSAVKAGHTLFVEVAIDNPGSVTVSDSAGNTYTKDADVTNGSGLHTTLFRSSDVAALAAGNSITVNVPGGTTAKAVAVQEFSGLAASPTDQTTSNHGTSTSPTSNSLGSSTTQANELLLGAIGATYSGSGTFTPGASYTALSGTGTTDGTGPNESIRPEYQIVSATGTYSATGTLGASVAWDAILDTYKADLTTKYGLSSTPASITAGTAFNLTVTAQQSNGSTDTAYTGTVHFTSSDSLAGLPSDYTFTTADAGVHTFSITLKTAGSRTITATDSDDNTVTATTSSITVSPAATSKFAITGPANATAGTAFNNLTVTAEDTYGNITSGYLGTIHFTSSDSQAVLPSNYTFAAANAGTQTFSAALKTSGSQTITATDTVTSSVNGNSAAIATAPAAAVSFTVTAPASSTAGSSVNITITVKDAYGNTATGYTGTVRFSSSDAQAVLPGNYTFIAGDAGVKTVSVTLKTAANQTVTATDTVTGSIAGTSRSVSVAAAAAATLTVSAPVATTAGSAFSVTITAKDAYGNTATGYTGTVHLTSTDGAAVLPSNYTFVAGDAGIRTLSATLKTAGNQTVSAADTVTGSIAGTSGSMAVAPAAATHILLSAPASSTAGSAFNLTVTALDAYGNTATGYTGTVHFTSSDGAALLPGDYTFAAANAGSATFSVTLQTAGNVTVTATDTVTSSISGTSGGVSVSAASASSLTISAPANATAGAASSITVTAKDRYGNTATGYTGTVHFNSSDGSAVLPSDYTFVAADAGAHLFSITLKTAGNETVTATDTVAGSIAGSSGTVATAAGAATHFSLSTPASTTAGSAFNVTITALDAYGNIATGYTGTVHLTSTDGAAVLPADYTFINGDAGVKTLSVTLKTAGSQTIAATDTMSGSVTGTSGTVTTSNAAATHLKVVAASNAAAGAPVTVTVTALDAYGNTAVDYAGDIHFTSTDGSAVLPGNYTFSSGNAGVATFSVTLTTAGNQTVTATDTVTGTITGASSVIAVSSAGAARYTISSPTNATAGAASSIVVTALDAYGNAAAGYTGTVTFLSSDGSADLPANYTFLAGDAGSHTFAVTLKKSGNQTITVTDTVTGSLTGTSGAISVAAAAVNHFSVSLPVSATAGTAVNLAVTALDAYGNTASGYSGTVHFTSSDAAAVLPADTTLTNGVGTFGVTFKTSGNQTVTATDTVMGSVAGSSANVATAAAAATHLSLVAPANATAGTVFSVIVTALDQYGNVASGYVGTVHLTSSDAAAALPADYSFSAGNGGVETLSVTLKTTGNFTITATDTVSGTIAGNSGTIATVAGAATHFSLSAPASTTAGNSFNVTVTALDAYGNTATAYAGVVDFTSSDGAATLPANSTLTAGVGTFSATFKTSGSQTISAGDTQSSSISGTSGAITTSAASATHLTVSGPTSAAVGLAFNVTVTAKDAYGNTDTNYAGNVHFSSSDSAAVLPSDSTLTNGTATFVATLKTVGNQTVTATDTVTGSIAGSSGTIATQAAPATHFVVTAPASTYAGAAFNVTVTALDPYGNTDTHYVGTVHFTSTDGAAVLPSDFTFASANNGTHTFSVDLKTSGNQTVTATDTVSGSITGTSGTIAAAAASNTHVVIAATTGATAGTAFSMTVTVEDQFNNPITSYSGTLHFTSSDDLAVLPADTTLTNGTGTFNVTLKTAGPQVITAVDTADNSINGTSASITTTAAAASQFMFTSPATATAGSGFNVTLTAKDPYGNADTGYVGTVHFASSDAAAVLPGDYTFAAANAGSASFSITLKTAGNQTMTATDTNTGSITGSSGTISTSASNATHLTIVTPTNATAGAAFNVTVTALDAYGNIDTGYTGTVRFTSSDSQAALPATYTFVSSDAGRKTLSVTLKTAANQTVTATDTVTGSIAGTSGETNTSPASATHFSITSPADATAGSSFSVMVTARDAYGNTDTNYAGTIHFTSSDQAAALPPDTTLANGAGTFSVTFKTSGNQSITVTDTFSGSIAGTTGAVATLAGAATNYKVSAPANATAGVAFNVTVTALDQYGNTATGYTGTVHLTSSDGAAILPADGTLTAGVRTFAVTLLTAGDQTITATDTMAGSINGASSAIAVMAAAASTFTISAPASATAGTAFNITVTAHDQYGNVATGYAGSVTFGSTDGVALLPGNSTLTAGVGSFSVTLKTAANETLTATDTVTRSITGSSGSINTSAAAATHLVVTATASTTAGTAFNITVAALDAYGNTATGYAGTVSITSSDGAAVLPANSTLTGGLGVFNVTLKTAGNQTVTASDTISGSIAGTSSAIAVVAGSATQLSVTAPASATAGSAVNVTVKALDAYGNTAAGYTGTIHFNSTDLAAILPADYTFSGANAGADTFSVTFRAAGNQTLTVRDTVVGSISGTSGNVATVAAAATHFSIAASASTTAGTAFNVTLTALDAYGNTATGYAGRVHFASSDGAAALPADSILTAGAGAFSAILKTAGNQTITAADTVTSSIDGTSGTISTTLSAALHFVISAPANATAGSPSNITVTVVDAYDNLDTAYRGTVHFTSSDPIAALPNDYTFTALNAGSAAFSATLKTAGNETIHAADTVATAMVGTSSSVAVIAATATHLILSAPATVTSGTAFTLQTIAVDPYGNTDTHYAGTVHFSSIDTSAVMPADTRLSGGTGGFTATLNQPGSQSVTIEDINDAALSGVTGVISVVDGSILLNSNLLTAYEGTAFSNVKLATFNYGNDSLPATNFSASIQWGDGTQSAGSITNIGNGYQVTGGHLYGSLGNYLVTVSVSAAGASNGQTQDTANVYAPLLPDGTRGNDTQRLISAIYFSLLGRDVDADALAFWTNALTQGSTIAGFVQALQDSAEYRMCEVESLYRHYLNRGADPAALVSWAKFISAGGSEEQVAIAIIGSPEYFQGRSSGNVTAFLQNVYQDVFGRSIESTALVYFQQALAAGMSQNQVATMLLSTNEYHINLVRADYQQFLGRDAEALAIAAFGQLLSKGGRDEQVVAAILGGPAGSEYYLRVTA